MGNEKKHAIDAPTSPELGKPFRHRFEGLGKKHTKSIGEVTEEDPDTEAFAPAHEFQMEDD